MAAGRGPKVPGAGEGAKGAALRKAKSACATLRAALPGYDAMMATLTQNGHWWSSFRQKTNAISGSSVEELAAFASRTYTSTNPAELGILVAAYARSTSDGHHLFALVDDLIVSDFAYSTTPEGIECFILLAKAYTDIGQPRRAWLMWRRGMAIAQLMV